MPAHTSSAKGRSPTSRRLREPGAEYLGLPSVWRLADTPQRETPLLLDTHVWLWLLDQTPGALEARVYRAIEEAAMQRRVFVSEFSFWEVAMLAAKGRLELAGGVTAWLDRAAAAPGITLVPVTRPMLVQSTMLPGDPHGDPADRILLATALVISAALLTCDRGIVRYAKRTPGVAVCDAR